MYQPDLIIEKEDIYQKLNVLDQGRVTFVA